MVGFIAHVLIKLWRPITFEPITYLIVFIRHTIRLTELNKNNYIARLTKYWFKSYGLPKFYKGHGLSNRPLRYIKNLKKTIYYILKKTHKENRNLILL